MIKSSMSISPLPFVSMVFRIESLDFVRAVLAFSVVEETAVPAFLTT